MVALRLDARWVIPIEPAGALAAHSVLIDDGRVVAVLPTAVAQASRPAREVVDLPTHAVLPGLVNAHTHTAMSLLRGIADDLPLKQWLEEAIWPREARFVSPDFVHDGTLLGAAEMLAGGITCCNDMYFYPDAAAAAYESVGMRALLGVPILDFPTPYAADADTYLQRGLAAREAFRHSPRLSFSLAPHAPYTVSDDTWGKVVVYARELDLPIQTHVAETADEVTASIAATGVSPVARLDALGVTGPSFIAVHAVHVDARDIGILARQHAHVVHCPASNMKLASGISPVPALLAAGVNVALGSDGAASNNRLDLFAEMRLASLLAKVGSGDAAAVPAMTALAMATLGGARALCLDDQVGSLRPGKAADVIAVDLQGIATQPLYDVVSHLVHAAGRECVTDVWVGGDRVVDRRELTTVDVAALRRRVLRWQETLRVAPA